MTRLNRAAEWLDSCLMLIIRYFAIILLLFSAYILFDTFYVSRTAFSSYDMLQYRPTAEDEGSLLNGFGDLIQMNRDAVGWLTIYDTNIDYPVVQGRDNFEYANKDVFGESSLTGAIYLDSDDNGFEDWFSIIYGHHMENGAMFGDIDNYVDPSYIQEHYDGYLQTPDENYRLRIFACIRTDAYEDQIYHYSESETDSEEDVVAKRTELAAYIRENAVSTYGDYLGEDLRSVNKLVLMSTCESGETYGRLVLLADAYPGEGRPEVVEEPTVLEAIGHISGSGHWAVLNLLAIVAVLLSLIDSMRQAHIRRKEYLEEEDGETRGLRLTWMLGIIEGILFIASTVIFIITENITSRMTVCDGVTPVMFIIMVAAFILGRLTYKKTLLHK